MAATVPPPAKRAQSNPNPTAPGNADSGWQEMPDVIDAEKFPAWVIDEGLGAKMPVYQSAGVVAADVKRAIIVGPGKLRDCWYYWNSMNNALYIAAESDSTIQRSEVSIMAPCFFTPKDQEAGAATDGVLTWGDTTWASGHYNKGPDSIEKYSSFTVMDKLVEYYMNRDIFPNLNTVVIAGHSLGAQLSQHYAALRSTTDNDDRLHFWIANPGSLLWLSKDRPAPNDACDGVDVYKYGLSSGFPGYAKGAARTLGREGIVSQYNSRNIHYAWGMDDDGKGDTRCQAVTQGSTHLERGQNFVAMLKDINGGDLPASATVDYVEGVSHYNEGMMNSDQGIDKLFKLNYNGPS
ncbi:hypothetical protein CYLTODRAFT_453741 [Cylindrobasidium torrendii FP15055 ss-10]|uniref:Alpha/beta-hydrolase n=1 Tax=Cylindrobasidium torrendii FP15055 ss-10 TaxID=1314674 RepID=A0A0D7BCK0_9AGAR|nr:hypothetical protein CYLTODRAFT_453741 [Cylindrobasidium torrendii FP15055 ss-10]